MAPDLRSAKWFKSTHSDSGGCVEVAAVPGWVGVRDTKDYGQGPVLLFNPASWSSFVSTVKADRLNP
ncbi:DUF397 domain-containing protein [Micromonospora fulviviridis]|uniref:DUF397 domain-containing protein n=1 Tax=Micromonospora fulviviridis TaxID=47860 RepID=A0ABV2VWU2_9ACTN